MVSNPKVQAAFALFRGQSISRVAVEQFAHAVPTSEFGICPSCWSLFRHGVRVGSCASGCALNVSGDGGHVVEDATRRH